MKTIQTKTTKPQARKTSTFFKKEGGQQFFQKKDDAQSFFPKRSAQPGVIQTKLTIGAADDVYEKEADQVADQVVRRCAEPTVQRKPIFESENEVQPKTIQRKCAACEQDEVRKKGDDEHHAPSDIESRLNASEGAGAQLPHEVRGQMESSFGADFGNVRIHTSSSDAQMSQDIGAQAFTHGSDIYFNSGKYNTSTTGGKHLLAHELTHVVQQSGQSGASPVKKKKIQRAWDYFWQPHAYRGTQEHNLIFNDIKNDSIITNAPIPNARTDRFGPGSAADFGKKGYADLYTATPSSIMGVFYEASQEPESLPRRGTKRGGKKYSGPIGPQVSKGKDGKKEVKCIECAPREIALGELKPINQEAAHAGVEQLNAYKEGIELASREFNEGTTGVPWHPQVRVMNDHELRDLVPDRFKEGASPDYHENAVLKHHIVVNLEDKNVVAKEKVVNSRLVAVPDQDPTRPGILTYAWIPIGDVKKHDAPKSVKDLGEQTKEKVVEPLKQPMVRQKDDDKDKLPRKKAPGQEKDKPPAIRKPRQKKVQRAGEFDLKTWSKNKKEVEKKYKAIKGSDDFKQAVSTDHRIRANELIKKHMGDKLANPAATDAQLENQQFVPELQFWGNPLTRVFGPFKKLLGKVYDIFVRGYNRLKSWVQGIIRKITPKASFGSGLPGAALKAVFNILKVLARVVMSQVVELFKQDVSNAIGEKLTELVESAEDSAIEYIESKLKPLEEVIKSYEGWIGQLIGQYQAYFDTIEEVMRAVNTIEDVISLVRWAARAVECLSPPLVGCLWMIAQAALEKAASWVVETCWFRKKIAPLVLKIPKVKDFSQKIYDILKDFMKKVLPSSITEFFFPKKAAVMKPPSENDIQCGSGGGGGEDGEPGGGELTADQEAVLQMQEDLGEEKFKALLDLLQKAKVDKDTKMTADQVRQLASAVKNMSPADIEKMADSYVKGDTEGVPVDVQEAVQKLAAGPKGQPAPPPELDAAKKEQEVAAAEARKDARESAKDNGIKTPSDDQLTASGEPAAFLLDLLLNDPQQNKRLFLQKKGRLAVNDTLVNSLENGGPLTLYDLHIEVEITEISATVRDVKLDEKEEQQLSIVLGIEVKISDNLQIAPGTFDKVVRNALWDPAAQQVTLLKKPQVIETILSGIKENRTDLTGQEYTFSESGFNARLDSIQRKGEYAELYFSVTGVEQGKDAGIYDFIQKKYLSLQKGSIFMLKEKVSEGKTEQSADEDKIMRKCACEEEETLQRKEVTLQRKEVVETDHPADLISRQVENDFHDTSAAVPVTGKTIGPREYVGKYAARIAEDLGIRLTQDNFITTVPFVSWTDGSSGRFAADFWEPVLKNQQNLYDILSEMIVPDFIQAPINAGRDAIGDDGTDEWRPGVITELERYVSRRLIMALRRVIPVYALIMNRHQLQDEEKLRSSDIQPRDWEIIAGHPIEKYVLPALKRKLSIDFQKYRKGFPDGYPSIPNVQMLRSLDIEFEAPKGAVNWIKVTNHPDATKEEVANELYGTPTMAWAFSGNGSYFALPLRGWGRDDLYRMKPKYEEIYQKTHPAATDQPDPRIPPEPLAGGAISDDIALSEARLIKPSNATKSEILQRISLEEIFLADTIRIFQGDHTFQPKLGWLLRVDKEIRARKSRLAAAPEAAVQQWDAQTIGQLFLLRAAYEGINMAVRQKDAFSDFPSTVTTIEHLAFNFTDVVRYSGYYDTGRQALDWANDQSQLFPIMVTEDVLKDVRAAIESAKKDKTEVLNPGSREKNYDIQGLEKKERDIRDRLVQARNIVLQHPDELRNLLRDIVLQLQDLRIGAAFVVDMDEVDMLWRELYDSTSFSGEIRSIWGGGNAILYDAMDANRKLWVEWRDIYMLWRSGRKAEAQKQLVAKTKSKEWQEYFKKVADIIEDHKLIDKWMNLALMVGVALLTGGLGAYVEGYLGAAWGVANLTGRAALTSWRVWAASGIAAGTEAATFTTLSTAILEKDPTFSGFMKSFGENILLFGGMKGVSKAYAAILGPEKMATVAGKIGDLATQFAGMNGYSLWKANQEMNDRLSRNLTWDEIMDISFSNLSFIVAMSIGAKMSEPLVQKLVIRGRLAGGLAAVDRTRQNLLDVSQQVEASDGKDSKLNQKLLQRNGEALRAQEDFLKDIIRIAADPQLAKAAGIGKDAAAEFQSDLAGVQSAVVASHLEPAATNEFLVASPYFDEVKEFYRSQKDTQVMEMPADPVTHVRTLEILGPSQHLQVTERISGAEKDIIREPEPVTQPGEPGEKGPSGPHKQLSFDERLQELLRLNPESTVPGRLKNSIDSLRARNAGDDTILAIIKNAFIHGDMRPTDFFGALNTFSGKFADVLGAKGFGLIVEGLSGDGDFFAARMLMDQVSWGQGRQVKNILSVFSLGDVGQLRGVFVADGDADFINSLNVLTSRIDGGREDLFALLKDAGGNKNALERLEEAMLRLGKGKFKPEQIRNSLDFGRQLREAFANQGNLDRLMKVIFGDAFTGTTVNKKGETVFKVSEKLTDAKPGDSAADFINKRKADIASNLIVGGDKGTVIDEVNWGTVRKIIDSTDLPPIVKSGIIGELWSFAKKQVYRNIVGEANVIKEVRVRWREADGSWSKSYAIVDAIVRDPVTGKLRYKEFKSSQDAKMSEQQDTVYDLLRSGRLDQLRPEGPNAERAFGGEDMPDFKPGEVDDERPTDK